MLGESKSMCLQPVPSKGFSGKTMQEVDKNNMIQLECEATGHSYGYFTITQTITDGEPETHLTCVAPMLKKEYEHARAELRLVELVASVEGIMDNYRDSFNRVVSSMESINNVDMLTIKNAQMALEAFIDTTVRSVEHFKTSVRDLKGEGAISSFETSLSNIYDSYDSLALLYKLRNIYQHEGSIPLQVNSSVDDDGLTETRLVLNGDKLLSGRVKTYLNKKVTELISSNPKLDIYPHVLTVFNQVLMSMDRFVRDVLIDGDCASACSRFIEAFASFNSASSYMLLCDIENFCRDEKDELVMVQTQMSLEYFCRVLSSYLDNIHGLLFAYWGRAIREESIHILPGIVSRDNPHHITKAKTLSYKCIEYLLIRVNIAFQVGCEETTAMLFDINEPRPGKEKMDECWKNYHSLLNGLKILDSAQRSVEGTGL